MLVRGQLPWWAPPNTRMPAHELCFTAPLAEMDLYLPWLRDRIVASGPFPVRGQLVLVTNPGLEESTRDEDNPAGIAYVHPRRHDTVLGGTFEQGRTDMKPDPRQRAAIIARCTALVPQLRGARVLGDRVGLRPPAAAARGSKRSMAREGASCTPTDTAAQA